MQYHLYNDVMKSNEDQLSELGEVTSSFVLFVAFLRGRRKGEPSENSWLSDQG